MKTTRPIEIRQIRKSYGEFVALSDVSLTIQPGEFITFLGPSGSGKSTLLMIIAGFTRPETGSILVESQELVTMPPHKRDIGLVFQNYALFPHMSVEQNVAFPLRYRSMGRAEKRERISRALEIVRLEDFGARSIDALSGGQKQRVALARALVFDPAILLMDEPLSALDKKLRDYMQIELKRIHREIGMTTVYVTHDQHEALTMSDRIAVLNHGRIMQIGTPKEIYERPVNHFVADFIGDTQFLPAEVDGETARVGAEVFRLAHSSVDRGQKGLIVLRPEKTFLVGRDEQREGINSIECVVVGATYQGGSVLIEAELPWGQRIHLRRSTNAGTMSTMPDPGSGMCLAIHESDTIAVEDDP